jgi:hypothetical protein
LRANSDPSSGVIFAARGFSPLLLHASLALGLLDSSLRPCSDSSLGEQARQGEYSPEATEEQRVLKIQNPTMDQRPSGDQDCLTGQRHSSGLEQHTEEYRQVSVSADQMQQVAQNRHVAARAFMARLTSTARISSEASACTIMRTLARRLRNAVSVGLKAVLVLKARKR